MATGKSETEKNEPLRKPKTGDWYYTQFESDYGDDRERDHKTLIIEEVSREFDNDVYEIRASDGTYYDCVWSEKHQIFVYSLD